MKYGFTVYKVEIDGEQIWFAESKDLTGCAGQGKTCDEAVKELELNENVWLEMAKEDGDILPEPSIEKPINYSGKFTVRLSKQMHEKAVKSAEKEGVSLNLFVVEAVAEKIGNTSYNRIYDQVIKLLDKFTDLVNNTTETMKTISSFNLNTASLFPISSNNSYENNLKIIN